MTTTGRHDRFSELIGPYLRRVLSVDDARDLEEHLATCAECRAEVSGARSLIAEPGGELTDAERASLHAAVTDAIGRPSEERTVVPLTPRWAGAAKFLTAAAAVAVVVAGGIWAGTSGNRGGSDSAVDAPAQLGEAEGGGDGGAGYTTPQPLFLGAELPALEQEADDEGAEEDEESPEEVTTDTAGNPLAQGLARDNLSSFAQKGDLFLNFTRAYVAPIPRSVAQRTLVDLAVQAPSHDYEVQVNDCGGDFLERNPGSAISVAAVLGNFEGDQALVIGYVTSEAPSGELNRYTYVVWRIGDCTSPITTFGGALVR